MPSAARPAHRTSAEQASVPRNYWISGQKFEAAHAAAGLNLVATPIGNLADVTIRALQTLAGCDLILAEDTRVTRKLLTHYGIERPLAAYHEHNAAEMRPKIMARLSEGQALALVSDAGTPLVSDPGYKLVRDAVAEGYAVTTMPGASSVMAGIVLSALPTDRFFFEGFLPVKSAGRLARAAALKGVPGTLVFFETGPRLAASLADLAEGFGPRPAAVARELTKTFEEVRRGTLAELAAHYAENGAPKGEIVLMVGPPLDESPPSVEELDAQLRAALGRHSLKDAVAEVTLLTGLAKRDVYQRALALAAKEGQP
jgi:16S rRNA (cytidine1402-2'-O)-methyltransferase